MMAAASVPHPVWTGRAARSGAVPWSAVTASLPPTFAMRCATAPLSSHAADLYAKFSIDHGDRDFSAIIETLRGS
jgi:hypothetical protein